MSDTLKHIHHISRILTWVCAIAIVFEIASIPLLWHLPGWVEASTSELTIPLDELTKLSGWQRYATMGAMMLPSFVMAYGLWHLRSMFSSFAGNKIFTTEAFDHLRIFGITLMLETLITPISGALTSVLATITRPEGERLLSIGLSDAEASTFFLGCLFLVMAWVLAEAAKIEAENRGFV